MMKGETGVQTVMVKVIELTVDGSTKIGHGTVELLDGKRFTIHIIKSYNKTHEMSADAIKADTSFLPSVEMECTLEDVNVHQLQAVGIRLDFNEVETKYKHLLKEQQILVQKQQEIETIERWNNSRLHEIVALFDQHDTRISLTSRDRLIKNPYWSMKLLFAVNHLNKKMRLVVETQSTKSKGIAFKILNDYSMDIIRGLFTKPMTVKHKLETLATQWIHKLDKCASIKQKRKELLTTLTHRLQKTVIESERGRFDRKGKHTSSDTLAIIEIDPQSKYDKRGLHFAYDQRENTFKISLVYGIFSEEQFKQLLTIISQAKFQ